MNSLSLTQSQAVIAGALAAARNKGYKPMGVVVVDAAAQAIAFAREDGASALRLDIAHGKAGAAIGMGVSSRALAVRAKDMPAFFGTIASNAQHPFIPQTGAVLASSDQSAFDQYPTGQFGPLAKSNLPDDQLGTSHQFVQFQQCIQ